MIKTSIIVPVYNTASYLRDCFDSIFQQTQKEIEVIAINDGSTDNSLDILEEIKKEHPKLTVLTQENQGLGETRNRGIERATGEFIYFMDSDDCLAETAMETCYQYAMKNHLDLVMFDAETFGDLEGERGRYDRTKVILDQRTVLRGETFANKYWLKAFYPSACLIYTSSYFLKKKKLRFLPRIFYEDNEFHCKSLPLAERVMYIPEFLYRRRYREQSITMLQFDMRHARDYLQMIQAIHAQPCSLNMECVVHKLLISFLRDLIQRCRKNHCLYDYQFVKSLFETALKVCGGKLEEIQTYADIQVLYEIVNESANNAISELLKTAVLNRKKEVLETLFANIPLQTERKCIGIYGTGRCAARFLEEYRKNVGQIKAKRIFIDSSAKSQESQYDGCDIYNVNDIGEMRLACIVVASSQYEQEIVQMLKARFEDRFQIICLSTDLKFC